MFNISEKKTRTLTLTMMLIVFCTVFISCQNVSDKVKEPLLTTEKHEPAKHTKDLLTESMEQEKQAENFSTKVTKEIELYIYPNTHIYITDASKISQIENLVNDILDEDIKAAEQEIVEGQTILIKIIGESGLESEYKIIANMYLEHSGHSYYISEKNSEQIDQLIGNLIN